MKPFMRVGEKVMTQVTLEVDRTAFHGGID